MRIDQYCNCYWSGGDVRSGVGQFYKSGGSRLVPWEYRRGERHLLAGSGGTVDSCSDAADRFGTGGKEWGAADVPHRCVSGLGLASRRPSYFIVRNERSAAAVIPYGTVRRTMGPVAGVSAAVARRTQFSGIKVECCKSNFNYWTACGIAVTLARRNNAAGCGEYLL